MLDFAAGLGYGPPMSRASNACHVAEITRRHGERTYRYYLLRRTYRDGGRVRQETLANLSRLPASAIDVLRQSLRGRTLVDLEEAFDIVRSRPHGHVAAVVGTLRSLGVDALVARERTRLRDLVVAMIVARVAEPDSKLATARGLRAESLTSSLGHLLDLERADEDDLYEAMDWLLPRQEAIERALVRRHLCNGTLALYDVTSTYFEGRTCPLARRGHNRDGKKDKLQIVVGLLCEPGGRPVAVRVFPGNTGDPKTLAPQIAALREKFGLTRLVLIGDRGMITDARIEEDLRSTPGLDWITALRAPAIRQLVEQEALQLSLFDERDLAEVASPEYPGERLVACLNPLLREERARKREELLQATERALRKVAEATQRSRRPLRSQANIALRVGKVVGRFKMAKHFRLEISDTSLRYERDTDKIQQEAALDGIYVIRTSVPAGALPAEETVRWYKRLAQVERAFRSLKTVDLHVRPIGHRAADRVRAHVFLCMLAYYVEWHMRDALAPMLFDDDDPDTGEASRGSVVQPAQRSPRAKAKARTKRTADGQPVHSFRTLLEDLRTICLNRVRLLRAEGAEFDRITTPTPLQQRAFSLLHVSPSL